MTLLRTKRLGHGEIWQLQDEYTTPEPFLASQRDIYTTPAGMRAVVRDMRVQTFIAATAATYFVVRLSGGGTRVVWAPRLTATVQSDASSCDIVLEAGDKLYIDTDYGAIHWYISGAEMPLFPSA